MTFSTENPSVQAAIIIAAVTITTVILGFIVKDFLIPNWLSKRSRFYNSERAFIYYKVNLVRASQSFNNRLFEILNLRSQYLFEDSKLNDFYEYKYISTIYRLFSLLAWIRAYQLSEASVELSSHKRKLKKVSDTISKIQSIFADGHHLEHELAEKMCDVVGVDFNKLTLKIKQKLSTELNHLIYEYKRVYNVEIVANLNEEVSKSFVLRVMQLFAKIINVDISKSSTHHLLEAASLRFALVFRDWQLAIGDLMLQKEGDMYTVMNYMKFEELWTNAEAISEKKWFSRVENVFRGLNFEDKTDVRVRQLRDIHTNVQILMQSLYEIELGTHDADFESFIKGMKRG